MRQTIKPLLAGVLCLLAGSAAAADTPNVVTSIKPVQSLVAAVMQGVGTPALIVEGAGSPHTYSLKPSEAAALEKADLVFWIGPGMENFLEKPLKSLASGATVVPLAAAPGLERLKIRKGGTFEADDDGDDDTPGGVDMHLWLDPENAKAFVAAIEVALQKADPGNAEKYRENAEAETEKLDGLMRDIDTALAPIKDKPFIVFHDGYHYFENRFDVKAAGSIIVNPETTPGARRIAAIEKKVAELGATCVFSEPQFEPKLIDVVTRGTKAKTGVLDPLGADLEPGPDLYFKLLTNLAGSLRNCLAQAN